MYSRYRSRRWFRLGLLYVAGVLVLMVAGLVVEAAVSPGHAPQPLPPAKIPVPPWAVTATPSPSPGNTSPGNTTSANNSQAALTGPLQVVQGRQFINGVYLGFPHSTVGAVSAADEFLTLIASTLDPDRAAAVMRMVADPGYVSGPQQAAEGAANDRRDLGFPASGPLPENLSLQTEPVEYQVRDVTADRVTVLLLCDFIATVPGQGTQTRIGVFPLPMHWTSGDWKILPPVTTDYSSLSAEPDSPQAAASGWKPLLQAGG
jgi:hypothetical protein